MAANFMATSRMIVLRIFIKNEDLIDNYWQLVDANKVVDFGNSMLGSTLELSYEQVEIYLAPALSTIFKIDLGSISDRKINDELLLGFAEDYLAEDVEICKPILMRLTEGEAYIAVLNRAFYVALLKHLSEHIKQVKFIQPFPFVTNFEEGVWTIYLVGEDKFVRTSQYEFFLLDDNTLLPLVLDEMLKNYNNNKVIVYADNKLIIDELESKYNLECVIPEEMNYGVVNWNFYNEKSKRFNLKLSLDAKIKLLRLGKIAGAFVTVYFVYWLLSLGSLLIVRSKIENQVVSNLKGIMVVDKFSLDILNQADGKMRDIEHNKAVYFNGDFMPLFEIFLTSMPSIKHSMITGIQYSGNQLQVFLNPQFDSANFLNDKSILVLKRIDASLIDYKDYQASQASNAAKNNNSGGILDNGGNNGNSQEMTNAAWVITLQTISRMGDAK